MGLCWCSRAAACTGCTGTYPPPPRKHARTHDTAAAIAIWRTHLWRERRAGRLLQQLLVAALDGAVALAQMDRVAVLVGQHLRPCAPMRACAAVSRCGSALACTGACLALLKGHACRPHTQAAWGRRRRRCRRAQPWMHACMHACAQRNAMWPASAACYCHCYCHGMPTKRRSPRHCGHATPHLRHTYVTPGGLPADRHAPGTQCGAGW